MADPGQEFVEPRMGRLHQIQEAILERLEPGLVVLVAAGEMRRDVGIRNLVLGTGDDAHPGAAGALDRREQNHVVDRNQIRLDALQMGIERVLGDDGGIDDRLPHRDHIGGQLVDRRQAEMRLLLGDEIGPELGDLLIRHAAGHIDQILLEAVSLKHALEAPVADEDRTMAVFPELLRDADAIQRRPERRLGKQHDRLAQSQLSLP